MTVSFARTTVTRVRGTVVSDRYNKETIDWANPDRAPIEHCLIQPLNSDETFDAAGARVVSRWRFLGPEDADLLARDRIELDGVTYDVDGEVLHQPSATGRLNHTTATLKKVGAP